jgi:N-ethylmaleimide reductase
MPNHNHNALLTPYQLGDLNLRNRIVMAPLTRTRAENAGHIPNDLMVEYYAQRASAGLIITEGTWVSEEAQGWYGVPGIYNEEQAQAWRRVTDAVHARGGRIFVQLWHQGGVSHPSFYPDSRQPVLRRRRGLAHRMRKKLNQLVEPFHAFQRCLRRSR